jgi:hypothetical protein
MASLSAFLPPHLVPSLAKHKRRPEPPFAEKFPAASLFSDMSGFTALTERLPPPHRSLHPRPHAPARPGLEPVSLRPIRFPESRKS